MSSKLSIVGWVSVGVLTGALATFSLQTTARNAIAPLPLEEIQQLAAVYSLIKTDYVEPVDDSKLIVDAEVGWTFPSGLYVNVGAQNLFDETPDDNPWGASVAGAAYPVHSPYGFNGGFYYARVGWKF